ncbi:hypothetical protein BaRGS_00019967 [Batillaria attramentaria]|uniref:Uncharacterized protein n=1 Tax=Batillaria attramentaria TaxID=370345 RepID=A0ABD0KPI0_9CAEN
MSDRSSIKLDKHAGRSHRKRQEKENQSWGFWDVNSTRVDTTVKKVIAVNRFLPLPSKQQNNGRFHRKHLAGKYNGAGNAKRHSDLPHRGAKRIDRTNHPGPHNRRPSLGKLSLYMELFCRDFSLPRVCEEVDVTA